MRILIPALCGSFALAGCQTTNIDDTIAKNLPKACAAISIAHASFLSINDVHPLSASIVKKEAVAYASSKPLCADPSHVTTANALVVASQVYAAIVGALAEAKRAGA